uniref:B30.2/SPRY domain-containing protein n=1 Tax=Sus scrofa TaxID=9823 RepID=A0A8D1T850_PIG
MLYTLNLYSAIFYVLLSFSEESTLFYHRVLFSGFTIGSAVLLYMYLKNGKFQDKMYQTRRKKSNFFNLVFFLSFVIGAALLLYKYFKKDPPQKHDSPFVFAVNVILDAATAHPALLLSKNGRRVTWKGTGQDLPRSTQRFNSIPYVLGHLSICSGKSHWEVEVGNASCWDLGICRDNVTKKEEFTMSPQKGFWVIRLCDGDYWALTSSVTLLTLKEKPLKVGIFLDYEAGYVSFYNMTDGSHIFSFSQNKFSGVLKPFFRLWSSDSGFLTICPGEE